MGKKVRQRPRGSDLPPPTQDHVHVRAVLNGGFILSDDGTIAAAIEVSPVDLALASDAEVTTRHEQFSRFCSGLDHNIPIQITVARVPQRCQEYRDRVAARVQRFQNLASQARDEGDEERRQRLQHMAEVALTHLSLFEVLLEEVQPRRERYLVIVWRNPFPLVKKQRQLSREKLEEGKREVERRLAMVSTQLEHIGLETQRVGSRELVQVFYSFYHMTTSPLARATRPAILAGTVAFADEERKGEENGSV